MAQIHGCLGQYAVCGIRTARLDQSCQVVPGINNAVAQRCVVTFTASPEREDGTEYVCKDGCGIVCWTIKDCDKEKRMNLDVELCVRDLDQIEIMTGAHLVLDADGNTIGLERQGPNGVCTNGATLELWAKVATGSGACPPSTPTQATTPGWWRYSYGRSFMLMGDTTMEDGVYQISMTGYAEVNPQFGNGPFNDYPGAAPMGEDSLESIVLDAAGPPTAQCGYIETPLQTGGAVRVEKSAEQNPTAPNGSMQEGDIITFSFTIFNAGNEDLTAISGTDDLVGALPAIADMAAGATPITVTVDYAVTGPDVVAGSVANEVTVDATAALAGAVDDTASLTVTLL